MSIAQGHVFGFNWSRKVPTYTCPKVSLFEDVGISRIKISDSTIIRVTSLPLAPQPNPGPGLLHKIRLNFLEASQQFSSL
jgi:hypothetical protein